MKRLIMYLLGSIIIISVLYIGTEMQLWLKGYSDEDFNFIPQIVFSVFFPIVVGMLLRIPQLVKEIKLKKRWSIDWIKLIAIGIPSLYLAALPLSIFIRLPIYHPMFLLKMITSGTIATTIAGVICGYILFDSLKEK